MAVTSSSRLVDKRTLINQTRRMTGSSNHDSGGHRAPDMGSSPVNFQLASQLLSALSSGLSARQHGKHGTLSNNSGQLFPRQQEQQRVNPQAQAAGQLLLHHMGFQQAMPQPQPAEPQHLPMAASAAGDYHQVARAAASHKENGNYTHRPASKSYSVKKKRSEKDMSCVVPCRARAMPASHNASVSDLCQSISFSFGRSPEGSTTFLTLDFFIHPI